MKTTYRKTLFSGWILTALLISGSCVFAQTGDGDGGQPGAFLRNGVSSRALGLGGAFTALANDPSALYWNPAGLATLQFPELIGTYTAMSLDRKYNFFSFGMPIKRYGAFGIGFINYGVGDIEGRSLAGDVTEMFSNSESAFYLSYGYEFRPGIYGGISAKLLSHNLADYRSSGFGIDFGLLYTLSPKIRLALAIQDLSTSVKWNTVSGLEETFPRLYRLGACFAPFNNDVRLTLDYQMVENQSGQVRAGLEYPLTQYFGVRAGYDGSGIVGGGYFAVPLSTMMFEADYSFGKDPMDLTYAHRISLRLKFGSSKYDFIPVQQTSPRKTNGEAGMLLNGYTARITKIVENYPNFALISAGETSGMEIGKILEVYRNESMPGDSEERKILIGEVKIVRVKTEISAVAVVSMKQGHFLQIGDFLILKD